MWSFNSILCSLISLSVFVAAQSNSNNTYDYIVVGSGPGGGPLAANLAKAGYSVFLIEAGEDQGNNVNETVPAWGGLASNDETMRWDFFVKYHTDEAITNRYTHLTWRQPNGEYFVGTTPPAGSTKLGVYYPRAGTLGGCSTHNAMASAINSNTDWEIIANLTGDKSWLPENMRKYFVRIENNHHVPPGTPGHGFNGYLDIRVNEKDVLASQSHSVIMLQAAAKLLGQDPNKIYDLVQRDLNNNNPNKDQETGIFGFPAHYDMNGKRVSARNPVAQVSQARNADGAPKYKLTLQLATLATKVLFSNSTMPGKKPQAIGVEYLKGKSMYRADPRSSKAGNGQLGRAYATKDIIISGGTFNSPQLLKLSGVGPKEELAKFGIPLVVDLPGVGTNLQDNYEIGVISHATTEFISSGPQCTYGQGQDPCFEVWNQTGKGPYVRGPLDSIMLKTSKARYGERDLFMWGDAGAFRGFWPQGANQGYANLDPPTTFGFSMAKMHPSGRLGTVNLRSADPRDVPEINFRFFEDADGDSDLQAMAEGIEFGRKVFDSVGAPIGPFVETDPCAGNHTCDVKDWIRTQAWSHHATSSCAIGGDNDTMAVLDSRFRVRGVSGLRVVDASSFPRVPGAFPVVPTFIISEKAADVILEDARAKQRRTE